MNLRIALLVCLLAASAARAQTTTVIGTIKDATGGDPSGTCTFTTEQQFVTNGGWTVAGVPRVVTFTSGALSVALVPTDTATTGGMRYRKACRLPLQTAGGVNCEGNPTLLAGHTCVVGPASLPVTYLQVPTSASPIEISTIERDVNPDPILRHWTGNYSPSATYRAGDGVLCQVGGSCAALYNGIGWISIQGGGSGHTPGSSPTWWVPMHTRQSGDYDTYSMAPAGYWNFSAGSVRWPEKLVSALPAASSATGRTYLVTDAHSASECGVGGGTATPALCWSNGTVWIAIGGGGGGGTPGGSDGQFQYNNAGAFAGGTLANCLSAGGVLQYTASTHTFSCHTLASADIPNNAASTSGNAATATTAVNLTGGSTGQFPYQAGAGATGFRTPNAANGPVVLDPSGVAAVGTTTVDPTNGVTTPKVTMPSGTPAELSGACQTSAAASLPAAGEYTTFYDSANSCKLSRIDHSRSVTLIEGGGSSSGVGRASLPATWPAIPDGGCVEETSTWVGVTTADTVALGIPSGLSLLANARVSAADTVTIRLCNLTGAQVTPGLQTFSGTLAVYNLAGTSAIDFASLDDGVCAANTFTLTGVAAGDPISPKWPSTLESGLLGVMTATATDTVSVRLCNWSGAAVDPASQTFGASIAK